MTTVSGYLVVKERRMADSRSPNCESGQYGGIEHLLYCHPPHLRPATLLHMRQFELYAIITPTISTHVRYCMPSRHAIY